MAHRPLHLIQVMLAQGELAYPFSVTEPPSDVRGFFLCCPFLSTGAGTSRVPAGSRVLSFPRWFPPLSLSSSSFQRLSRHQPSKSSTSTRTIRSSHGDPPRISKRGLKPCIPA